MDDQSERFSSSYNAYSDNSRNLSSKPQGSTSSGLRLVLPPLKSILAAKGSKKTKRRGSTSFVPSPVVQDVEVALEKKPPRPVKLKPLKEVLSKLISQIKKKDDYAFFLTPVDAKNVPGYLDVVKTPMDFGTMTDKVTRGRYRSLDEFADDFRLVTTNAKIFNPPGSIYYTEADKIEAWGLEHINKAAGTVIQYEADWNIDIEKEDDAPTVNIVEEEEEEPRATPMEIEDQGPVRSASVVSQQPTVGRRGPRGPYRKHNQATSNTVSESMEPDGRLPGSKDGIGAFPPGSDWARTMLSLKLKGKRYKTKKERMRIEKEGPPTLPDGSLDYTEMEDPFSVLSFFVPDPAIRPNLIPLYPPLLSVPSSSYPTDFNQLQPPSHDPSRYPPTPTPNEPPPSTLYPLAASISFDHPTLDTTGLDQLTSSRPSARRHWHISRNVTGRTKGKDRDDDLDGSDFPSWQTPREAHPTDFGSFGLLAGELAEEMRRRGMTPVVVEQGQDQQIHFDFIRDSLEVDVSSGEERAQSTKVVDAADPQEQEEIVKNYWTKERIAEAESYLRDLVYGGGTGLAYVRSLAEFLRYKPIPVSDGDMIEEEDSKPEPVDRTLGMPLAQWVEQNVVDTLTDGLHSLVRQSALLLESRNIPSWNSMDTSQDQLARQVAMSLDLYPTANAALAALRSINMHKIDMGALIKTPGELFVSEEEWFGKELKDKRKQKRLNGQGATTKKTVAVDDDAMEVEESMQSWATVDANLPSANDQQDGDYEPEGPEELKEVLDYSAAVILDLQRRNHPMGTSLSDSGKPLTNGSETPARTDNDGPAEDPVLRNLRLNLLALAKRAPLDTIARLPKDLVPEHIRQYVPTLGSST